MLRWAIMFDWRRPGHECIAAIAQLGERQTEDLKVAGSIPAHGNIFSLFHIFLSMMKENIWENTR